MAMSEDVASEGELGPRVAPVTYVTSLGQVAAAVGTLFALCCTKP